jgi:hypothetical protein
MPVNARRLIRKMRGGAQAHLLECDDGHYYVVKFRNNPQHRRILVNEWVSSVFVDYLQIASPPVAMVNLSRDFLEANPEVHIQLGSQHTPAEEGWHFGSRYPGDPARVAVYDFLPDVLLGKVENSRDFLGIFAFDKWMANADSRQAIFFRARLREHLNRRVSDDASERRRTGFIVSMMDHGYVFDGPHWNFQDSPLQGLYHRNGVYEQVRSFDDFQPWLDRIVNFPPEIVDDALKQIPPSWVQGDEPALESLLETLQRRRKRVPELIREVASRARINPFPNWR